MSVIDLTFVDEAVARLGRQPDAVIPILQAIQEHYRYLPPEALERVCARTDITPAALTGVATFYDQFRHRPVGRQVISVCHGTACHVKGTGLVQDELERRLGLTNGADTDAAGQFTVQKVACLGCCTLAPVLKIEQATYGRLTPQQLPAVLRDALRPEGKRAAPRRAAVPANTPLGEVRVGMGSCCQAQGSDQVHAAVDRLLAETGVHAVVKCVGCTGMCHQTPMVEVVPPQGPAQLYSRVRAEDAPDLVLRHFQPPGLLRRLGRAVGGLLDRLLTDEPAGERVRRHALDVRDPLVCAFLGRQKHLATEHGGQLDPLDLDEYLRHDGFVALRRCLEALSPDEIIAEVQASGLRGRGGAGFPSGIKWGRVRSAAGGPPFVICNGDEGDPGAFMDRMVLESFPYRVIEGLAIAARAVGARQGYFYIRAEYPLAVERIRVALHRCTERGLLGEQILGSDFGLTLEIKEGAGAFVCGEETALIASIEGQRGMPRLRPPYPAESGLWGKPTLINNVETLANIPAIVREGAEWFASIGTEGSKGTKVFALAGKVCNTGLVEVPMGMSLREIVLEIGGGAPGGGTVKAVQTGGPSGGCIPSSAFETPVGYESLAQVGSIMGSGGMIVMDQDTNMVDVAKFFMEFCMDESCGKCVPCRAGTVQLYRMLTKIIEGRAGHQDLERLEALCDMVKHASLCGLGQSAPNPVLSTLRYYRDEYLALVRDGNGQLGPGPSQPAHA